MPDAARAPRFTFFGGKGGVGKTTCAAAAAVRAAHDGACVLVVSTDPAHSLSDALGQRLGPEARVVRRVAGDGALYAAELDADRALSRWLRDREDAIRTIADRGTYLDDEDIDRLLSLAFPGVDELVGLVELVRLSRVRAYDAVVVDTAPTGHTLRLLEMPHTLQRLSQVLDDMHAKHRFLASSLGGAWRADFADAAISEIDAESRSLRDLLTDRERASFSWITLPEELSLRESKRGVAALAELGVACSAVVINRVWPAPDRRCALCMARVGSEDRWRRATHAAFPRTRVLELPALAEEPCEPEALLALAMSARTRPPLAAEHPSGKVVAPRARGTTTQSSELPIGPSVRLVLVGGKGGVGKTTIAAASALELAKRRPRDKVLVLSTDPAHSLGDALATSLGDEARPIPGGPSNLVARELDAAHAWEAERERYRRGVDDLFSSIFSGKMDASFDRAVLEDLLDLAPPGIDELLALVTILDALVASGGAHKDALVASGGAAYDLVVVDTAPTGHTLRLLALPEKALEWVHALMGVILKYRSVVGLGEFASDLTQLARRLRTLIGLLTDPRESAFVIVTRPGRLPRLETERLARELARRHVPVAAIVANAVTEPTCSRCTAAAALERTELSLLDRFRSRTASMRGIRLLSTRAVYPGPIGVAQLAQWRTTWTTPA